MNAVILRGDARSLPLADASVDLIITSPPYFAMRSYQDGGKHYEGQIGAEEAPRAFLDALWQCTAEWMRVLKPQGSLWVNLGDKYSGAPSGPRETLHSAHIEQWRTRRSRKSRDFRDKSLMGLPWRYALGCVDDLGLILRAEVIWSKTNAMPESVTDRVRRTHEHWFHFTQQPRYYSAVDEIRMPVGDYAGRPHAWRDHKANSEPSGQHHRTAAPLGGRPGSVWEIPTQRLKVPPELGIRHFAAFPMEFPRRIILGWSPCGICVECGQGRRPVADVQKTYAPRPGRVTALSHAHGKDGREGSRPSSIAYITTYACDCFTPTASIRPAVVLDPFGGTGTTALVASVLGRLGLSVDLSADYCTLATWRVANPQARARALGRPAPATRRPAPARTGQQELFKGGSG